MQPMFDIYTIHADGSPQLVESVRQLTQAQDMASRLSCLFPGKYFAYFERTDDSIELLSNLEAFKISANLDAGSVAFLA